jgi:endonuclease III
MRLAAPAAASGYSGRGKQPVKNAATCAKKLSALLKKYHRSASQVARMPDASDPIATLVMSFLLWESTSEKAAAAYERLLQHVVDFNDLRVCMPHETTEALGPRYPRVLDRGQRLRAVLKDIYLREHAVNINRLRDMGKREVKKYLESLEGMVPYVSARVMLLCFQTHAVPVDDHLRTHLVEAGAIEAGVEIPEVSAWLASQIKAEDGIQAHAALQAFSDEKAGASSPSSRTEKRASVARTAHRPRQAAARRPRKSASK